MKQRLTNQTDRDSIRLELVRLVYRHDKAPDDAIERARELERYVFGQPADKAEGPR
jgi:hypothetical protein